MTRFRLTLSALALALTACSFAPSGGAGDQPDAATPDGDGGIDALADAGVDAPPGVLTDAGVDAPGALPIDSACTPLAAECAAGLTCRLRGGSIGVCRPVGPLGAGAQCASEDQCGAMMACIPADANKLRCMVICEVAHPEIRCSAGQTCIAFPQPGTPTGLCVP